MPGKINFPSRTERQQLLKELRELEAQLGKEITSSELYQNYVNALNALDQKMEGLYELGSFGLPPSVTAEDKNQLTELLLNVGRAGEQFLGDAQEKQQKMNTGMPRLVSTTTSLWVCGKRPRNICSKRWGSAAPRPWTS